MESKTSIVIKYCSLHKEEPIIRVSLDLNESQRFYCYDCLEKNSGLDKSKMIKFNQLAEKLHEQLSSSLSKNSKSEEQKKDLSIDKQKVIDNLTKLEKYITQQKILVDKEFTQLETELNGIVQDSKKQLNSQFDNFSTGITEGLKDCLKQIDAVSEAKSKKVIPTLEELEKDLEIDKSDVKELEEKVKQCLEVIKINEEIENGEIEENLNQRQTDFEETIGESNIITTKKEGFYKEKLEDFKSYLIALALVSETEENISSLGSKQKQVVFFFNCKK